MEDLRLRGVEKKSNEEDVSERSRQTEIMLLIAVKNDALFRKHILLSIRQVVSAPDSPSQSKFSYMGPLMGLERPSFLLDYPVIDTRWALCSSLSNLRCGLCLKALRRLSIGSRIKKTTIMGYDQHH
ncbi:hypothetical protein M5689_011361 [Euphorbia peplus]|nr:hypothetical protein M5689_011361 [Euphorbia peplus]